jgi:hypothetical protein
MQATSSKPFTLTFTHSADSVTSKQMCVFLIEFMTTLAMCLGSVFSSNRFTSEDILAAGHGFKMRWPNAESITAEMVKLQAFWYKTIQCLKCPSVGWITSAWPNWEGAVAASCGATGPYPTATSHRWHLWPILVDTLPESFLWMLASICPITSVTAKRLANRPSIWPKLRATVKAAFHILILAGAW